MTVAFYLRNSNYNVDYINLDESNPGIGGTEYLFATIPTYISKRNNGIKVILYVEKEAIFESWVQYKISSTLSEAIEDAEKNEIDCFVFDFRDWKEVTELEGVNNFKIKFVAWAHCFYSTYSLDKLCKLKNLMKIICVGREQRELLIDHFSYSKTDYIYNYVPYPALYKQDISNSNIIQRANIVTFIGSLTPHKCFHILAELWPQIKKEVPDAELYVIGGTLYSNNVKLGKYGISEENYEKLFMQHLTNKDGSIRQEVHFCGNLGKEKYDILKRTKVGVPNPTGKSETFCISAVEMQAMGCSVCAMKAPGYLDTIYNGVISSDKKSLQNNIIRLLKMGSPQSYNDTISYLCRFSMEAVITEWEKLFMYNGTKALHSNDRPRHLLYRYKFLKYLIAPIKYKIPFFYKIPSIDDILRGQTTESDYALN